MADRQWTVVVVADDQTGVRQYSVSRNAARLGIAAILIVLAATGSLLTRTIVPTEVHAGSAVLRTNALLRGELGELTERIDSLRLAVDGLAAKDDYYRLLAGLEPLDAAVHLVGVGGPGLERVEASPLYATDQGMAQHAFLAGSQVSALLRRAQLLAFSWREAEDSLSERRLRLEAFPSITPTNGLVRSSFSSSRWHPILDRPRPHTGIDIVAPVGTPVVAAARGRVVFAGAQGGYGLMIDIDHGFGHVTRYAHLSAMNVQPGQLVVRGDAIGAVGQSGLAVGPHLHYEVLVNGQPANPSRYLLDFRVVPE